MSIAPGDSHPLPSAVLQERYGAGYFRGENSGFAAEGYENVHATWRHWMDFVRAECGPRALWLDLGCAYGFLVEEAFAAGFRAIGLDASRHAASRVRTCAPSASGRVACGHAERLPFADAALDVVSAFDVLEHVPNPLAVLRECARVLRPGGLLLGATPDPMTFGRDEPTHVAEHVPSWWVRALEDCGFGVAFRFFQAPYNLELVGRRDGPAPVVSYDALGAPDPVLRTSGDPALRAALRSGFGEVLDDGARVVDDGATLYLLNAGDVPLEVSLALDCADPGAVKVALDGRIEARSGDDGPGRRTLRARLLLSAGGHGVRLSVGRGWARLHGLELDARPGDPEELRLGLPFDLYDRYALAAAVVSRLAPGATRLLDVGGTMGGDSGHLAWTGDFFPGRDVTVVDTRLADLPRHVVVGGGHPLPFCDREIDVVLALDVLEHVPPEAREDWLAEIWRVAGRWLLLGNPFGTPGVVEADRWLFDMIRARWGYDHRFLAEHLGHRHPDLAATRDWFLARGASVAVLPSGHLPTWLLLQATNAILSHPEQDRAFVEANRAANRAAGAAGIAGPSYRHLLVVDRAAADHAADLAAIAGLGPGAVAGMLALVRAVTDAPGGTTGGR